VLIGRGDGYFGVPPSRQAGVGPKPLSVAISDLNADGKADLAVVNSASNTVSVLLGKGDGTMESRADFGAGRNPVFVAVGDLNADGRPDLAVANYSSNTLSVLLNQGPGRNRPPVANAGGPYSGTAGVPLELDGSASADPDGEPLTFSWELGDGASGSGSNLVHTYSNPGLYDVVLSVRDRFITSLDSTTASITSGALRARVFPTKASGRLVLSPGKGWWSLQIEPADQAFSVGDVDRASVTMQYAGAQALAIAKGTEVVSDADENGVPEVTASFAREDLRGLLGSLPRGKTSVRVTVGGRLIGGGTFLGTADFDVMKPVEAVPVTVSPNPLNPNGSLAFYTQARGPLRVTLYDVNGRLIRTLMAEPNAPAGDHEVMIDGRDRSGRALSSGVYFYRVETSVGTATGRFAVVK
jgi:PKD repeat protein